MRWKFSKKKKKKINLSLPFNENIMHSSWEFFFGLQFFSLLICYVLDVSEVSHDDVLAKEHNSPLIGTCYVFAWHHAMYLPGTMHAASHYCHNAPMSLTLH